ncbi:hypothetical protein OV079_31675 [Nannocystis pusilla]|uniref:Uncharacterized protein n=1 Tax=Nannocystis pusilla TaxID=889268 RepID=A0A9X3J0H0_9BACT|nr:hypothetical protein [Nannocystis pusilla]MCY1010045.1 hypothetical protein [Nannocystis pusilla]
MGRAALRPHRLRRGLREFLVEIAAQSATICGVCGGAGYHHCLDGWEETICDACRARAEMQIDGPPGSDDDFER